MAGNASNNNIDDALIMSVDFNSLQAKFAEAFRALFLEVNYVNSTKGRIIAFTSKRLTPAQVKYGVTSKEACVLVHCLRKFRIYIHGNPCIAITDHKAIPLPHSVL